MASSSDPVDPDAVYLCKFCLMKKAKYVCPKCGTPFCSVNCYKSEDHVDCSEAFYQEWVEGELKGSKVSVDGKKKMLEILKRISNEDAAFDEELDSDDEASLPDLSERLAGIDINDSDVVWEKLSVTEQAAFKELIKTGDISSLIPAWEPWWFQRINKPKLVEVDKDFFSDGALEEIKKKCPRHLNNIKPLSEITKIKPSQSVSFDLINILGGYCITVRYYNGSHFDFPEEAASVIHKLSKSLTSPQKLVSAEVALDAVGLEALTYSGIEVTQDDIESMKTDVKRIMDGPSSNNKTYYMLSSFSDMYRLFSNITCSGPKAVKGKFSTMFDNPDPDIELLKKDDCKIILKRLKYFLSWLLEYGNLS
ncbi:zinc finger HIT domain-containing protein 2 [Halyomorpha halys]|uniref:zinc finger HIT domain-containing protein 2 n=1 Tax=Halyomorpha halys TaxID=286706 RepID=UPI0006D4D4A8|nr:zinc finger HIT domain-containing protein 2 [Halyomorpha halys]